MKKVAPYGILLLAVIAVLVAILRGDPEQLRGAPPQAEVVEATEITWKLRDPDPGGAPSSGEGKERREPNIAGEVADQGCRTVPGIIVQAVDAEDRVLAEDCTGDDGRFAMLVPDDPPFNLRMQGGGDYRYKVSRVPRLDIDLFLETPPARRETLYVKAVYDVLHTEEELRLQVFDSMAQTARGTIVNLADSPWLLENMEFGTYDVRVWNSDASGFTRRFKFGPESRQVEVVLSPPASMKGTLNGPARAILIPDPPMGRRVSRGILEGDGRAGEVRTGLADTGQLTRKIEFQNVPAGKYRLVLTAPGFETLETTLNLAPATILDLGDITLQPASGAVRFYLNDGDQDTTRHGYLLTLYTRTGALLDYKTTPGESAFAKIRDLSSGTWYYRAERRMAGGGLRAVGADQSFEIKPGQTTQVEVDLNWPF